MGHLGQAGALAAQNVLHGRLVAAEGVMALFEQIQKLLAHTYLQINGFFPVCLAHTRKQILSFAKSIITDSNRNFQWIVKKMVNESAEKMPKKSCKTLAL